LKFDGINIFRYIGSVYADNSRPVSHFRQVPELVLNIAESYIARNPVIGVRKCRRNANKQEKASAIFLP
jgi:hypothetical protein